jgi:hypothetical protein
MPALFSARGNARVSKELLDALIGPFIVAFYGTTKLLMAVLPFPGAKPHSSQIIFGARFGYNSDVGATPLGVVHRICLATSGLFSEK